MLKLQEKGGVKVRRQLTSNVSIPYPIKQSERYRNPLMKNETHHSFSLFGSRDKEKFSFIFPVTFSAAKQANTVIEIRR